MQNKTKQFVIYCAGVHQDSLLVDIYAKSRKGAKQKFTKEWGKEYKIDEIREVGKYA